jgi:hypothetical protein
MTLVGDPIGWGATIDEPARDQCVPEWTVELHSEPLGSRVVNTALERFAADARRLAPSAHCSQGLGRFHMRLTVYATTPEEAADTAEEVFRRALETALWPHSALATFTHHEVLVEANESPSAT